jgi:hypothetical protein
LDLQAKAKDSAHKEGGLDDLISSIRTGKAFNTGDQQTQRQRRPREPSVSRKHGEDKQSFSSMQPVNDVNAINNRLRRQEPSDIKGKDVPKFRNPNENSNDLAKLLAKDNLKSTAPKKEPVVDPRANLKSVGGGIKETPSEIRNRFEAKVDK